MARSKTNAHEATETRIVVQQNNNVLYLILAVLVVALAYMFVRLSSIEKKLATGAGGAQVESYVSVENLKKYAKELKLDTGKFNRCLDGDEKKNAVTADATYGSSVGVSGTPGFFINGRFVAGAYPYTAFKEIIDKELAGTGSNDCATYTDESLVQTCDTTATQDDPNKGFKPVPKTIEAAGQVVGPTNAKVTIVEFSDFECPFCVRAYPTVKQIMNDYKNQVRFVYRQYPLTQIHPNAQKAAEASLCAADQGKFWEMHDKMFEAGQAGQ